MLQVIVRQEVHFIFRRKLAVASLSRIILLFDENGELRDRFATKPAYPQGYKNYTVVAMCFSLDSRKIAIAQSDEIIFVYKIGLEWGERKCICNKFLETSSIVTIIWPNQCQHEFLFGLLEGKIKLGNLKTNKAITLYTSKISSPLVSLTYSRDGSACLVGHLDGTIIRVLIGSSSQEVMSSKILSHGCVPLVLSIGKSIVVAGPDGKVIFYGLDGNIVKEYVYIAEEKRKGFCSGCFHHNGEAVIVGHFNGFHMYSFNIQNGKWQDTCDKIENSYTVSAVAWDPCGRQVAVGTSGKVDIFDIAFCKKTYNDKFELTYVTGSKILIKHLQSGANAEINTCNGFNVQNVKMYKNQYLIAHTSKSLLLGNLENFKISEIVWSEHLNEKFIFDNPLVCGIYIPGELYLVEYGRNKTFGPFQTDYFSPCLFSLQFNNTKLTLVDKRVVCSKAIAYLNGLHSIKVVNLISDTRATIVHDCDIQGIQLDQKSRYLLFCDKKHELYLLNLASQERRILLNSCTFMSWIPHSNAVIAQAQCRIYVWYKVNNPYQQAAVFWIKGEAEGINRGEGKTELLVKEGDNIQWRTKLIFMRCLYSNLLH